MVPDGKKFEGLTGDLIKFINEAFPEGFARDQGMCRVQEAIWWWNKAVLDHEQEKKRKEANGESKAEEGLPGGSGASSVVAQ